MNERAFTGLFCDKEEQDIETKEYVTELEDALQQDARAACRRMSEFAQSEALQGELDFATGLIGRVFDNHMAHEGKTVRVDAEPVRALFVLCFVQQLKERCNRLTPGYKEAVESLCIETLLPSKVKDVCYRAPVEYSPDEKGEV